MIKIAVIGCGHWGPNFVRNFSQLKGVCVKYACDLDHRKLTGIQKNYPDIITTNNFLRVLKDKDVEAVVIVTPAVTHYKLTKQALLRKKHVLVEKPIAKTTKQAQQLINIARSKKRVLMVGHIFKFNSGICKLKSLIKAKKLGRIYYIYSRRTNLGPLRKDVNSMWDLALHDVYIISYLLGSQPLDVTARGKRFLSHGFEDVSFMTMTYPKNMFAHVHVSWLDPRKVRDITVVGDKQMAVFDDLAGNKPIKIYDKSVIKKCFKQDYNTFKEFQMITREGKVYCPRVGHKEPLKKECSHFIQCIRGKTKPLTDGRDGLSVLRVMVGLEESLKKDGKLVKLKRSKNGA